MGTGSPSSQGESSKVAAAADVRQFFQQMLSEARARQRVEIREETEAYVVNLLAAFVPSEQLFVREDDGGLGREPLAFMLKRAVEAPREQRARHLRRMGDTALYMSGFFADAFNRDMVDVDYYAAMGGRAYDALGEMSHGEALAVAFRELAAKFLRLVDLLNEISERSAVTSNQGLMRLYERYSRTGSTRLRGLLAERGVLAMPLTGWEQ
jgi:hypothetical protein